MTREGDNKYRVEMRNGDWAEAESLTAALRCAEQLHEDGGYENPLPLGVMVEVNGKVSAWATTAAYHHLVETAGLVRA
jgi:hypothetical protein